MDAGPGDGWRTFRPNRRAQGRGCLLGAPGVSGRAGSSARRTPRSCPPLAGRDRCRAIEVRAPRAWRRGASRSCTEHSMTEKRCKVCERPEHGPRQLHRRTSTKGTACLRSPTRPGPRSPTKSWRPTCSLRKSSTRSSRANRSKPMLRRRRAGRGNRRLRIVRRTAAPRDLRNAHRPRRERLAGRPHKRAGMLGWLIEESDARSTNGGDERREGRGKALWIVFPRSLILNR